MPTLVATRISCAAAAASVFALVASCSSPNPAFHEDQTPGGSIDADAAFDARDTATIDGADDAGSESDLLARPDGEDEPDVPGPLDPVDAVDPIDAVDALAPQDGLAPQDAPFTPDVATPPDGNDAGPVDVAPDQGPPPTDSLPICSTPAGNGSGLQAQFFGNVGLTGTPFNRIDGTINWDFGAGGPGGGIASDNFSGRWTGQLQPVISGPHTFVASFNDGMRMFLDERVVLYRWGPRLTTAEDRATVVLEAGRRYDLRFEFFDQGSAAVAKLFWENSCQTRQVVPRAQLYPVAPAPPVCPALAAPGSGTGLKVDYFSGRPSSSPVATANGVSVDVAWGTGSPAGLSSDNFSARWTGSLEAPITGPLTIYLSTDDLGRVRIGGALIMDSFAEPFGPQEVAATIDVQAGQRYPVLIEHWEDDGGAFAHLYWSWPCQGRVIVPLSRLYPP